MRATARNVTKRSKRSLMRTELRNSRKSRLRTSKTPRLRRRNLRLRLMLRLLMMKAWEDERSEADK